MIYTLNTKPSHLATYVNIFIALVFALLAVWIFLNRQLVIDQLVVWNYQPSSSVKLITEKSDMSDKGQFYFYASQPAVNTATEFNRNCAKQEANSAILGCYSAGKIFIYDVPNAELQGVEEVTAAHETLHAAWDRLDDNEKKRLAVILEVEYTRLNDAELIERLAYYDRTEPGEHANELHSILGTEYNNLAPELESHYAKYFNNRSKVVALHDSYKSVFDNLKQQSNALSIEIANLKSVIDSQTIEYNAQADSISQAVSDLQNSASDVDRTISVEVNAYNAKRRELLSRIGALDSLRASINNNTQIYNEKVASYNKLIVSTNQLTQSLDSTLAPTPSL